MNTTNSTTFAALAEPNRLSIVDMLARQGELSASTISMTFSCTPSAISQHLKVLHQSGLVRMQKRGQKHIYSLNTAAIVQAQQWLEQRTNLWNARLNAMESHIQNNI